MLHCISMSIFEWAAIQCLETIMLEPWRKLQQCLATGKMETLVAPIVMVDAFWSKLFQHLLDVVKLLEHGQDGWDPTIRKVAYGVHHAHICLSTVLYEVRSEFTERTLAKSVSVLLHALVQSDILDEDLETYVHAACTQIFEGTSYTVPKSRLWPFQTLPLRNDTSPTPRISTGIIISVSATCFSWYLLICEWPRNLLKMTPSSFDLKICTQFSGKNPMKYSPSRAELAHSRALLRCPRRSSVTNYELTPPMCRLQLSKLLLCSHIFHNPKKLFQNVCPEAAPNPNQLDAGKSLQLPWLQNNASGN